MTTESAVLRAAGVRGGSRSLWQERIDTFVKVGLTGLLIASTLNGLTFDWQVFGREITVRPDQVVLVVILPLLALAVILGRFRLHLILFDWVVLGFLVSNVTSSLLVSSSRNASLQASVLLGAYAAMYFVARQIVANRARWLGAASDWVLGLGIAQALYCLLAVVLYSFGYVIHGLQIGHVSETSIAIEGTFWEANLLGAYFAVIAVFITVRYMLRPERNGGGTYLLGLFITTLALPLTLTRAAGLAFVLGMSAIALIVWIYRRELLAWRTRAVRIGLAVACASALTVTAMNDFVSTLSRYPNLLVERWIPGSWIPTSEETRAEAAKRLPTVEPAAAAPAGRPAAPASRNAPIVEGQVTLSSQSSADGRLDTWLLAAERWRQHPILGHGPLAGAGATKDGWWYSSLVQALDDTGLLGLALLLWIHVAAIVYPLMAWLRTRRSPMSANLLGLSVGNAVLFLTSQFSNSFYVGFPWVFLGLTMGAVEATRQSTSWNVNPESSRARALIRKPLVAFRYYVSGRYRAHRYAHFWQRVGRHVSNGWWLDLGGGPGSYFLSRISERQKAILVDIDEGTLRKAAHRFPNISCVVADGRRLPFNDRAIACIFCNSVIEHVPDARGLAEEIGRVGSHYFIQTPNGRFPIEVHSAVPIPLYQFLPRRIRPLVCKVFGASFEYVSTVTYLSEKDLRNFFPSAVIERERVLGLTKSYYVFGGAEAKAARSSGGSSVQPAARTGSS